MRFWFVVGLGVAGLSNPDHDGFWVDYLAHELAHQFDGYHTFNSKVAHAG